MSLVVLVILAMVWAVFLLPQLVRARAERSTDSIGAFQHQLSVLEKATPVASGTVTRLRPALVGEARPMVTMRPTSSVAPAPATVPPARPNPATRHRANSRAMVRKRRRDIFCGLLVAMGVSLVLSLVPALRMMLWVHLIIDIAFVGYVSLLVRVRNLAAERELKVRFLPAMANPRPQLVLRRSATN